MDKGAKLMHVERTQDAKMIEMIITHPEVYPYVSDDGSPEPEDFSAEGIVSNQDVYALLVLDKCVMGMFMFHRHNAITWEIHTCLLPGHRGKRGLQAARLCAGWMFDNTPCRKIVTHVPAGNEPALKFAINGGMTIEGVNRQSFLKNGVAIDQAVLGITAEEFKCQQ